LSVSKAAIVGSRGGQQSALRAKALKQIRIDEYVLNPSQCALCGIPLPYEKRDQKFCGHSCRATLKNQTRERHDAVKRTCVVCDTPTHNPKFCSLKCQAIERASLMIERIEAGDVTDRKVLKWHLIKQRGHRCECCRNTEWLSAKIPLELEHRDGDASHNKPDNLALLCPNCHAQTPTAKGRNRGNGRKSRGIKVY
jgi:predicted nucleic acid-binding Zn ribbon protein